MDNRTLQSFIVGFIAVQLVIKLLKKIIKQKRPVGAKGSDYGMPSRRAGMSLFIVSFLLLCINNISMLSFIISTIFVVGNLGLKIIHHEHSIPQLFVGSIIGAFFGYIFYNLSIII